MLAYQSALPIRQPLAARQRSIRRPFHPLPSSGPYRLPHDVRDRLTASLAPFRNRDAAFTLATFLGRFWSMPSRIIDAFPIDRRALADHGELGLTEKQIRSAIRTLEKIGFLDRTIASGSRYKATEDGLRRKPIRFMFGSDYALAFMAANRRAVAARGGPPGERRAIAPEKTGQASMINSEACRPKGPKAIGAVERTVTLGPIVKASGILPKASEPNPKLEAALDRLLQGIRQSRGG